MSSKKKLLNQQKYLRRLNELKKASARVDTRIMTKDSEKEKREETKTTKTSYVSDSNKYQLPINEIKKDLKKNLIFAIFSILLVVGLKISGFGFEQVKHLMNL